MLVYMQQSSEMKMSLIMMKNINNQKNIPAYVEACAKESACYVIYLLIWLQWHEPVKNNSSFKYYA